MSLKEIWRQQRQLEEDARYKARLDEQKLRADYERALAQQNMPTQQVAVQPRYIDPRDFPDPQSYKRALRDAQRQADLQGGVQNAARGQPLTPSQIRAQQDLQKEAMAAQYKAMAKKYLGMAPDDPARYAPVGVIEPPLVANFFVPDLCRANGPKLWRKEIAAIAAAKLGGKVMKMGTVGIAVLGATEDVRPYLNAVLAGLTHHVRHVERVSISVEPHANIEGQHGMTVHLVEVLRTPEPCQFEQMIDGRVFCHVHQCDGAKCMQAKRERGDLRMAYGTAAGGGGGGGAGAYIQNIKPVDSPFVRQAQAMANQGFGGRGGGSGGSNSGFGGLF